VARETYLTSAIPNADTSFQVSHVTTANMTQVVPSSASAVSVIMFIRGTVDVNTGGTFIPQMSQSSATGFYTLLAGSFFNIYPIGASGNISVGSWA
jgi:hypothetical protein